MLYPSATEKFLRALPSATLPKALLDELFECIESYATLDDAAAIAAYDPSALLRVSKVRYLLFALEAHVSEFYIFCQRLDALLTPEVCIRCHQPRSFAPAWRYNSTMKPNQAMQRTAGRSAS